MPISSLPLPGDEEAPDASSQVAWLHAMGDREALFQIMDSERRSKEGLAAAAALAQLGDVRGLDYLIATLQDAHSRLRMEAGAMLEQLGHPRGLRALQELQKETQSSPSAAEREQVYEDLNAARTDELMAIWHENDRVKWSPVELEVIESILLERLGSLPARQGQSGGSPEVDEDVDPRIQKLWIGGDVGGLRRVMVQESDPSLQLDAAEALASLGHEGALDFLIDMLDEVDEERNDTAAKILDWLDLPRGNAALRERGYEFETSGADLIEVKQPQQRQGAAPQPKAPESWEARATRMPTAFSTPSRPEESASPGTTLGVIATGAAGGLLGFLMVSFGLDVLGIRALPNGLSQWFGPSMVYGMIESLVVGAVSANVGRRVARAMATRDGDDVEEQDARLVLGALFSGAAAAVLVGVLRLVLGD